MCMCNVQSTEQTVVGSSSSSEGREILPAALKPINYDLWLQPDLTSFTFDGTVAISVSVHQDTNKVVLNSKELTIHKATVTQGDLKQTATSIEFNKAKETVTFEFESVIAAGSNALVYVEFTGVHNDQLHGFYRSSYNDAEGNKRHLVVTQFEACDARQAFPSFDEPALKATFDCTLVVDADLAALSNMNEVSSTAFVNTAGRSVKEVKFARTPIMSTYLLAFVVGDFECVETVAKPAGANPITVRVFALRGSASQGEFALGVGARTLEYFSEYFNEAYPLPKCDMVAIPDFGAGAMENWGLVTYRNVALLCNEATATTKAKKGIAYVIAHELAHQWFGNLVTMSWWNDLWLNEGFATFVGWLATDHLFPEWDIWTGYITGVYANALNLDSFRSSHPIQVDVKSANDIGQIFDAISYSKGSSVIRMLNDFLGGQIFMDGVRTYLQEFKYKNTVTADLWRHLSASSGLDISTLMHGWTRETGYPLLTIENQEYNADEKTLSVTLSQSRFLAAGDLKPEEDQVTWWVPITVVSHLTGKSGATKHVLAEKNGTITFPYDASENAFWKLNFGASGLYRVKYQEAHVAQIGSLLQTNLSAFSAGDRIMFINDAYMLSTAGLGPITSALDMIKALALAGESEYNVLNQIKTTLDALSSSLYRENAATREGVKQLARLVFGDKVAAVGYDFPETEEYFTRLTRSLVIEAAASAGVESVQGDLRERFDRFVDGDVSALHPEIRGIAYINALATSDASTVESVFTALLAIQSNPKTQDSEKNEILRALGSANSPALIDRLINVILFDKEIVRMQDFMMVLLGLVNGKNESAVIRPLMWQWFQNNYEKLRSLYHNKSALGGPFRACAMTLIGDDSSAEVESWARGDGLEGEELETRKKDTVEGYYRAVDQTLESIRTRTALANREKENIAAWVASNF
ncbi:peptidase family M1-domain-containing protein [Chytriomyces cf. hyalinus JEL632]|nr:peptidase family M1-domain-containing protein [Chytriomyces cf. hyalinus JEL632]